MAYREEEGWHTLEDGTKLYTKTWKPAGETRAKLVFVHGFSDHCNAYYTLFPTLASRGIEVLGFDQRGWGRSVTHSSHRGHCGPTSLVLSDITSILSSQIPSPVPLFLMGHSMGGAEVLTYAALGPPHIRAHIRGYLAESPLIAVHPSSVPSRFTIIIGRLAAKLLPKHQLKQRIESKWVSRDPEVARIFMEDDLCHDTGTLEGLSSMLDRSADLVSGKVNVRENPDDPNQGGKISIWVGHGTEDHVTSFEATQKWMDKLDIKDKTFKIYDGWYHKLHAEPGDDKIIFANDVADWILARSATTQSTEGQNAQADNTDIPADPTEKKNSTVQGEEELSSSSKAKL